MLNVKDQRKCVVHFEDEGMFPKSAADGFWRIQEGSLPEYLGGLGLKLSLLSYKQKKATCPADFEMKFFPFISQWQWE